MMSVSKIATRKGVNGKSDLVWKRWAFALIDLSSATVPLLYWNEPHET